MESRIIDMICRTCNCNEHEAAEELASEVENLKDLMNLDDLRYTDFELACENLGLDKDYVEYFIEALV